MTTELNHKFAEAYGVAAVRPIFEHPHMHNLSNYILTTIEINTDTLTLFQLCIEHDISVEPDTDLVVCHIMNTGHESFFEQYKNHETKEAATCSAMFAALCKLKGVEE